MKRCYEIITRSGRVVAGIPQFRYPPSKMGCFAEPPIHFHRPCVPFNKVSETLDIRDSPISFYFPTVNPFSLCHRCISFKYSIHTAATIKPESQRFGSQDTLAFSFAGKTSRLAGRTSRPSISFEVDGFLPGKEPHKTKGSNSILIYYNNIF